MSLMSLRCRFHQNTKFPKNYQKSLPLSSCFGNMLSYLISFEKWHKLVSSVCMNSCNVNRVIQSDFGTVKE